MNNDLLVKAQQLLDDLAQGRFEKGEQYFDSTIQSFLPTEKLRETWQALESQMGIMQGQTNIRTTQVQGFEVVIITCAFAQGNLAFNVSFNKEQQVSGITFTPFVATPEQAQEDMAAYIQPASFHETEVQVGQSEWALPGTLTLPEGEGPFPALVLVHGSGPQDRDETIGPNKPFRDLAQGLASQHVAVLRYEKRTKFYTAKMPEVVNSLTVQEETIDDALEAIKLLHTIPQIASDRIFMLGHSLGGYLLPRIGVADRSIAGFIILAGSTRPLEDILVSQTAYLLATQVAVAPEQQQYLETLKKQVALIKSQDLTLATSTSELPFNVPPAYWLDLRTYHPTTLVQQLTQPMLIMQAESDYQVTPEDFAGWQEALADRSNVTFKSYPGLSHLFMPVADGKMATPATYAIPGHVDETVVNDIAHWLKG